MQKLIYSLVVNNNNNTNSKKKPRNIAKLYSMYFKYLAIKLISSLQLNSKEISFTP